MIAARKIVQATLVVTLLLIAPTARAQQPASPAMGPDLSTPALKYFGKGKHTLASRSHLPRPAAQTRTYALTGIKPFQNVTTQLPTVTPSGSTAETWLDVQTCTPNCSSSR